jgi:hypothetical protein
VASLRLRFWLVAMDATNWLDVRTHSRTRRLYLWTVGKAADAVWAGAPALPTKEGDEPW